LASGFKTPRSEHVTLMSVLMANLDKPCHRGRFSVVKAVTINISLNPELAEFARADSAAHAFDSMSEYMRDLIRRRRQERINEDVALLEKAIAGAPTGDPSEDEMAEVVKTQRRIRTELKRARRA
jgi:Arc/MetJ-type ribon-helix-helix transcriptional regulator